MLKKVQTFVCLCLLVILASLLFQPPSFAFDPDEREAKTQERRNNAEAHVNRTMETAIDTARETLRKSGSIPDALNNAGKAVVRECTSCHDPGPSNSSHGGRNGRE